MKTKADSDMSLAAEFLPVISLCLAAFLSYLALMARPDSGEELLAARLFCWVVVGPVYALTVLLLSQWLHILRSHIKILITLVFVIWIVVGGLGSWWQKEKVRIRSERAVGLVK